MPSAQNQQSNPANKKRSGLWAADRLPFVIEFLLALRKSLDLISN